MAEFSAPFDGSPIATQSQWSRMARRWGLDGVHGDGPTSTALKVTGNGTGNVSLAIGEAFVNGFYYSNDTVKSVPVTANAGSVARIDMVVLRASMSSKTVRVVYRTGGTSAPTLASDETGDYEIPLAQCTVAAGSSVVTTTNVLDRRWFTGRGVAPSVPGARRPSARGQLLVEGTGLFMGDGADWKWLATGGVEEGTYTPVWTCGANTVNWGSNSLNAGRYQVMGRRVDLTIELAPTGNPPGYDDPLQVTLPPGYPCTTANHSLFIWHLNSGNGEGSAQGNALTFPTDSTSRIARIRYPVQNGSTIAAIPNSQNVSTNTPYNIRSGDEFTLTGTYWTA
ncbi:hypothetical protein ACFYPN_16280 [Streptomyces sp. NPDC005576]|uniref:hypothetical protein n=1 Tax=Streptomyces sp. NPDC005576 TaxID=3364726 RepID=UPI0036794288